MKKVKKAVHLVFTNFVNDARVLKETGSLQRTGNWQVDIFALHSEGVAEEEMINGVRVHRIALKTRGWPKNFVFQLIKFGELSARILKECLKADVVHCHDIDPLPLGVLAKILRFGRLRLVYDAHELETEQPMSAGRKRLLTMVEKFCVRFVDSFITVSPGIAEEYATRYRLKPPNLILNCPPATPVARKNIYREKFGLSPQTRVFLYQGGLVPGRGLELLLETFKTMDSTKAVLVVMGSGSLLPLVKEAAQESTAIKFHPAVPFQELLQYTASADVGILSTEVDCLNSYYCLPNKFFEYSMAGLAIISNDVPEVRKLVTEYQSGVMYSAEKPETFQRALEQFLSTDLERFRRGSLNLAKTYNWESQEQKLRAIYQSL